MKTLIPLVLCSFTLSGCITVNMPDPKDPEETEGTEQADPSPNTGDSQESADGQTPSEGNSTGNGGVTIENRAPNISGTPDTVVAVNSYYEFTPVASDPDNDALVFSVSNLPSWASFDVNSGQVSGVPTQANSYESIIISVSDGTHTQSLDAFDINVQTSTLQSVEIRWQSPTEDVDGLPLNGISGYKIFYGQNQSQPDQQVTITNGNAEQTVISNLEPGGYYFSMVAITTSGVESAVSSTFYMDISQ